MPFFDAMLRQHLFSCTVSADDSCLAAGVLAFSGTESLIRLTRNSRYHFATDGARASLPATGVMLVATGERTKSEPVALARRDFKRLVALRAGLAHSISGALLGAENAPSRDIGQVSSSAAATGHLRPRWTVTGMRAIHPLIGVRRLCAEDFAASRANDIDKCAAPVP